MNEGGLMSANCRDIIFNFSFTILYLWVVFPPQYVVTFESIIPQFTTGRLHNETERRKM